MKLKEFDLWCFKLPLKESRKFTLFNRCVCAHFERHFQQIGTNGKYRIIIKLSESDDREYTTEESSSVLKYYKTFDFNRFYSMSERARKIYLLDTLCDSLIELCEIFDWPKKPFKEAYEKVLEENFINTYIQKRKSSPNRKLIAEIECHHESAKFDCYLKIKNKEGKEVFAKLLFSEEPDEFLFNGRIGDVKWLSNDTLIHINRDKMELERFELETEKINRIRLD